MFIKLNKGCDSEAYYLLTMSLLALRGTDYGTVITYTLTSFLRLLMRSMLGTQVEPILLPVLLARCVVFYKAHH
jgi:hypothetical protein